MSVAELSFHIDSGQSRIQVVRPRLPELSALSPYLARIDENRFYSNHGPLLQELERRLCFAFGLAPNTVSACSNGTMALWAAILAARRISPRPGRNLCLVPGYTFVGTLSAVQMAGLSPWICDVDPWTWALDPATIRAHPRLEEVAIVVPVAPYDRRPDLRAWAEFSRGTGIAVVIDAAACFEWLAGAAHEIPPEVPLALSLHATKSFGCGEGGLVVATDPELMRIAHATLNFGFGGRRTADCLGANGKMSEYHAAVALAELDGWPAKAESWARIARMWRAAQPGLYTAPDTASCYALLDAGNGTLALETRARLARLGIDTLSWYGTGLSAHPAHADLARDELIVTQSVGMSLIGLPCHIDLTEHDIARIADALILPLIRHG